MLRRLFCLVTLVGVLFLSVPAHALIEDWEAHVSPSFVATNVVDGVYDIGILSGDVTYEFAVRSNPDETETSMALIGRIGFGETTAALKYEQRDNTGNYGATVFGVADHDFGIANAPGEDTHVAFVSSEGSGRTALYTNGVYRASVDTAITLSGLVGIGYAARAEDGSDFIDNFDGDVFGVAIYNIGLSEPEIAAHSAAFFVPEPATIALVGLGGLALLRRKRN